MKRFHLMSLIAGTLTAAVLLYLNLTVREIETPAWRLKERRPIPAPNRFYVAQGWPFALRQSAVLKSDFTPDMPRGRWRMFQEIDTQELVANCVACVLLTLSVMVAVEVILRRRNAVRGAT